jgi:hypothetical protein
MTEEIKPASLADTVGALAGRMAAAIENVDTLLREHALLTGRIGQVETSVRALTEEVRTLRGLLETMAVPAPPATDE